VLCHDPPQIFDMRLPPTDRLRDRDRALAERRRGARDTYSPFTIDEYRAMPLDYSFIDECVGMGRSRRQATPRRKVGAGAAYPDVPALIISGELDSITTMADGSAVAAAFPHGVQVRIANSFHVNALPRARSDCGAESSVGSSPRWPPGYLLCIASAAGAPRGAVFGGGARSHTRSWVAGQFRIAASTAAS